MVAVRDNALRLEVGISYQWAIDAQQAVVRHIQAAKSSARATVNVAKASITSGKVTAIDAAISANRQARTFAHETPRKLRDRLAGLLLGIDAARVNELRDMVLNPPATVARAGRKSSRTRSAAKSVALEVPKAGMNVDAREFRDALDRVARAVSNKTSLPVLGHVLLECKRGLLTLSATDLEVGIQTRIEVANRDFAPVTLPCKLLRDTIAKAGGAINLRNQATDRVMLEFAGAVTVIDGLPAEEFPQLPEVKHREYAQCFGLAELLGKFVDAVYPDETKPIITGVYIDSQNVCSTDTYRLHTYKHGLDLSAVLPEAWHWNDDQTEKISDGPGAVVIPSRVCAMLVKALGTKGHEFNDVAVGFSESQAIFRFGDTLLISRLIEGQYPCYDKVVPAEGDYSAEIKVDKSALLNALSQVAPVARENSGRVLLCGGANGKLALRASSGSAGVVQAVVDAEQDCQWADGFTVAMSCKYLVDALNFVGGDRVRVRGKGPLNQFRIESEQEPGMLAVVMPMQVS